MAETLIYLMLVLGGKILRFPLQEDIRLEVIEHDPQAPVVFFAPHESEDVVNDYLSETVRSQGGRFYILHQAGRRNIVFAIDGQEVQVDPNRIFTQAGATASILRENPGLDRASPLFRLSISRAICLGRFILAAFGHLPENGVVVAIHNNTQGFDDDGHNGIGTISMKRYRKKQAAGAKYIAKLHIAPWRDDDDLFFITRSADYEALTPCWNVLLQAPEVAILADEDDGSLSVWAEMAGLRYFNLEAQRKNDDGEGRDHLRAQKRMVRKLFKLLRPTLRPTAQP